uniref:Ubiquinol oxidase n=2 Tax=Heterosigma akashiwo TaxID=2829 RepID=A0A7S3Y6H1_HETAK
MSVIENSDGTEKQIENMDQVAGFVVDALKGGIGLLFPKDRPFARFYALETIARMPYFAYLSVLHLYETVGRWRRVDLLKLHFAESWNEMHHLLIMEELGGNEEFKDRFFAQHIAFFYYFFVVAIYMMKPELAYSLNKKVEEHAFATYDEFLNENEEMLKQMPVPKVAADYYSKDELFLGLTTCARRAAPPALGSLYDVFLNVREDEAEHAGAMGRLERQGAQGLLNENVDSDDECDV